MERIVGRIKKFICITLLAVFLSSSIINSYQQAQTVHASAIPAIDGLTYLFQMIMSGNGQACGSTEDLFSLSQAFQDFVNNGKYTFYTTLRPLVQSAVKLKTGDTLTTEEYQDLMVGIETFLQDYLTSLTKLHTDDVVLIDASFIAQQACGVPPTDYAKQAYFDPYLDVFNKYGYVVFKYTGEKVNPWDHYELYYAFSGPRDGQFLCDDGKGISIYNTSGSLSSFNGFKFYIDTPNQSACNAFRLENDVATMSSSGYKVVTDALSCPVYKSYDDYCEKMDMYRTAGLKHDIFGRIGKIFDIPKNVRIGDLEATQKAQEVIANNPDMSADEINALVSQLVSEIIMEQQQIKDSVEDNTDAVVTSNTWLGKIYKTITETFPSMVAPLDAIQTACGIISAGVLDMGHAIDNLGENILEGLKPIDLLLRGFEQLSSFLQKVLTGISANVQSIPDVLAKIRENVLTLPGISDVLEKIRTVVIGIPKAITDALDIAGLRDLIITLPVSIAAEIEKITTLDDTVVDDAVEELTNVWELKLPFIPVIVKTFEGIHFTDKIDYPVIKMQVPKFAKQFFDAGYIVVLDTGNFATFFVSFRSILRAIIWAWFGWSVLNHFKVQFHVG